MVNNADTVVNQTEKLFCIGQQEIIIIRLSIVSINITLNVYHNKIFIVVLPQDC